MALGDGSLVTLLKKQKYCVWGNQKVKFVLFCSDLWGAWAWPRGCLWRSEEFRPGSWTPGCGTRSGGRRCQNSDILIENDWPGGPDIMGPGAQLDGRYKTKKLACWRDDIRGKSVQCSVICARPCQTWLRAAIRSCPLWGPAQCDDVTCTWCHHPRHLIPAPAALLQSLPAKLPHVAAGVEVKHNDPGVRHHDLRPLPLGDAHGHDVLELTFLSDFPGNFPDQTKLSQNPSRR